MNLPNKLTLSRIIMVPVFVLFFYLTQIPYNYIIAAAVFSLAAITDFLDGYIARKYNLVTNLGKFLDPIADKILVSTAFIVMLEAGFFPAIYGGIAISLILARELIISALRTVAAAGGIIVAADKLGKYKAFLQDISIIILLVAASCDFTVSGVEIVYTAGLIVFVAAVLMTVVSGVSYIIKNRQVFKG